MTLRPSIAVASRRAAPNFRAATHPLYYRRDLIGASCPPVTATSSGG